MNTYPQIIYGDKINTEKQFRIFCDEFDVKRCVVCGKLFWEYLGCDEEYGFICDECYKKTDINNNVIKYDTGVYEWGIPKNNCIVTDVNILT